MLAMLLQSSLHILILTAHGDSNSPPILPWYQKPPHTHDNVAWLAHAYSRIISSSFLGELIGTFLFLFVAFGGTQTAYAGQTKLSTDTGIELMQLLDVALSFGFSFAANVCHFYRISGGLLNPGQS